MAKKQEPTVSKEHWPDTMADLAIALIGDYHLLRAGKITVKQAQAGAKLADSALRSVNLQLMGLKYLGEQAKQIENG